MCNADRTGTGPRYSLHRFAMLAVVAVAWLQLAAAAHAFEHLGSVDTDLCEQCAQFERTGDAALTAAAIAVAPAPTGRVDIFRSSVPGIVCRLPFRQRAPPAL